jgi:ABC-2 type transport system ATP-binding protein
VFRVGITVVLGPNGAGKSTLLKLIAGALRSPPGAIAFPTGDGKSRPRVGYLAQEPQLLGHFRCHEFVAYAAWLHGLSSSESRTSSVDALERVGLSDRSESYVRELSGGMKRRLSIAAALVGDSDVLLLDEPMSGLDPLQRAEIRTLIRTLSAGAIVVVSTHILQDLPDIADRVLLLNEGRAVFAGSFDEFAPGGSAADSLEHRYIDLMRSQP